jgi:hypothetical protein
MEDPKVTIGGREFTVPEFPFWAQRKVSPALLKASANARNLEDEEKFGQLLDAVYFSLTISTVDGKPAGAKINDISKEDFECLKIKALHLATEVLPILLRQAGLIQEKAGTGGGGAVQPDTPLPGKTTSTT